ncbi:carboxylesterase/lipase family protein [Natronoflexus pectinivorans]|uniref:Carboxylic ester hydrolase n=1 Tax=Natronoflexus pectinivorans TaxID=682526 RepID=A0A4V2RWX7_9BACT|nr:carboxylesterase family protein [Natronoflexus pectinivorans]TCO10651.1 para-nitrobenzyl esterase [Natronoflexus pectinivorans]
MKYTKLILIALLVLFMGSCKQQPGLVAVEGGLIQGVVTDDLLIFKGVPFAAPPIGDLRWKAPQPVKEWYGVLETVEYAPAPMQGGDPVSGKSEDCLYLNIWTPAKSTKERLPVLVWIYGGGFSFGSTSDPVHNGEHLARKGVVVVSIAYRVGQFGFLAHPELSAESPNGVSGNYGLLDQIAGLEWIQRNISQFGGDPDKVTIFGESAGGISVSMLCASPVAKGLFHGAVSQSGGSFGPTRPTTYPGENMKTLKQAEKEGIEYANRVGASSIEELRKIDANELPLGMGMGGAWPIVDGYVIPGDQYELYEKGQFNDVPVLIGYNSDEGLSFPGGRTPQDYIDNVNRRFGPFADDLLEAYPVGETTVPRSARNLMRDAAFGWPTWAWANLQSEVGHSPVFFYYFDQHPEYPEDSPQADHGTPHGVDVPFVFMNLNADDPNVSKSDLKISEIMGTYWTNFAKYGHPNGGGLPEWPKFTKENPNVMYLGPNAYLGPVPDEASLLVMDAYYKWRRTPEGKDWAK